MSALLFLTSSDFSVGRGVDGQVLCVPVSGFSLMLFYSEKCEHCKNLIPIFKKLPGTVGGCQFGMINVNSNRKCIEMAKQTIAPIQYVPYIVMYDNGKPVMTYKGPHEAPLICRFVVEVAQNIRKKQQNYSESGAVIKKDAKSKIPAYTIGHPLCGKDGKVCYLEFDGAYTESGQQPPRSKPLPVVSGMV
jgi:thiol-disulfide isomerase/thioredoxin